MSEGLAAQALRLCREKGLTVAAAESCTGGMIASRITGVPGASQVFLGGVVSYTNGVKEQVLHVPGSLLTLCGAVSAPVARAMAMGVRLLTGADIAVAVTGLRAPTGTTGATRWGRCSSLCPPGRRYRCGSSPSREAGRTSGGRARRTRWR